MVVDAVVQHWALFVEEIAGGKYGCGREVRHHGAFLYAGDGMVPSTDLYWLQGVFKTLTRLFNRVVLRTNVGKTFKVV